MGEIVPSATTLAGGPEKREYPSQFGIIWDPGLGRCRTKIIDGPGRHHDFRTRARGADSRRVYFGNRRRIGADLSQPPDHARGAVPARRRDRCDRAHHAGQHVAIARPADRDRKHRRRRRHDRRRSRRPRRARRLYGAAASSGAGGRHDALSEAHIRRRKGFRHHRPRQHRRFDRCGTSDAAAEQYRRAGALDEGARTEHQDRASRRRLVRSFGRRAARPGDRRDGHADSLSGRRPGAQ